MDTLPGGSSLLEPRDFEARLLLLLLLLLRMLEQLERDLEVTWAVESDFSAVFPLSTVDDRLATPLLPLRCFEPLGAAAGEPACLPGEGERLRPEKLIVNRPLRSWTQLKSGPAVGRLDRDRLPLCFEGPLADESLDSRVESA